MLYQIELPYATYGVTVENDLVVEAPPIAGWMVSKKWAGVQEWVKKKGGEIKEINN